MKYENLHVELKKLQEKHHLSLLEMANKTGVAYVTLQRIVDGKTKSVQESTIRKIANSFDCIITQKNNNIFFSDSENVITNHFDNIKDEILNLIKNNNLSIVEMASKIGMSYNGLRRILDSDEKLIHVQNATLRNIAMAFNCEISKLENSVFFIEKNINEKQTINAKNDVIIERLRPNRNGENSIYRYVKKRYNISKIANDTKLTRPTILGILNGDTKKPGCEKLNAICELLNMTWDYDDSGLYFSLKPLNIGTQKTNLHSTLQELHQLPVNEQNEIWKIVDSIIKLRKKGKG